MVLQSNGQLKSCHLTVVAKSLTVLINAYIADTVSMMFFVIHLSFLLSVMGEILLRVGDYATPTLCALLKLV
jgi:hypothetical protein